MKKKNEPILEGLEKVEILSRLMHMLTIEELRLILLKVSNRCKKVEQQHQS